MDSAEDGLHDGRFSSCHRQEMVESEASEWSLRRSARVVHQLQHLPPQPPPHLLHSQAEALARHRTTHSSIAQRSHTPLLRCRPPPFSAGQRRSSPPSLPPFLISSAAVSAPAVTGWGRRGCGFPLPLYADARRSRTRRTHQRSDCFPSPPTSRTQLLPPPLPLPLPRPLPLPLRPLLCALHHSTIPASSLPPSSPDLPHPSSERPLGQRSDGHCHRPEPRRRCPHLHLPSLLLHLSPQPARPRDELHPPTVQSAAAILRLLLLLFFLCLLLFLHP